MSKNLIRGAACAAAMLALSQPTANAAGSTIATPGAPRDFAERLGEASLSFAAAAREDSTAQDILAAAQADYANLLGVLYAQGYYNGAISILVNGREAAEIPPLSTPDDIERIAITVERGAPFRFGRAEVAPLARGTTLPEGFRSGEPALANLVGAAARSGITGWREAGHAKADIARRNLVADHRTARLDAEITLAPGPRLRFGALRIDPSRNESRVREARIREIAGLPEGERFDPEALETSANRLRRTGAFRSVSLREAETPNPDDTLDIDARIDDAKPRRVGAGIEFGSTEGVTLSGFWLHRNLFGGAERLRIDGIIGGIGGDSGGADFRLGARLDRPATFTPDTNAFLLADIEDNDEPDYTEQKAEIGGGVRHIFSDELRGEATLLYRFSEIDDDLGVRRLQHLLLALGATLDRRDDELNPTEGLYFDLSVTPFARLDEAAAGARIYADIRDYLTFGAEDGITLAGRAQIGSVSGAERRDVPADMLFYSGGAGTVRGQEYRSLGVDAPGGGRIGGRSFVGVSGEIRGMVTDAIQAVVFADGGFIGEGSLGSGEGEWHGGAGLGARYLTPVGPIRVDLATPLDDDAGNDFELYIGIGQAF